MAQDPNDRTLVERVDPLLGSVLDRRYRIDFRLAAGGFGAIYHATHVKSGHEVALKVLHPQLASDEGVVARFRREGATLTTLRSPHTITAYELGEAPDGTLYIVMELLRGESLFERYRARGPFAWKRMAAIARAVCHSLEEAHALGIVHRDLKPTNINLEDKDGNPEFVKVLDFGIAKILRGSDFDSSDLTHAGQMIGTLDYMAPEQMVGGACTGQSDIYVLGIVIYEMIAGCRPFEEANSPGAALGAMLRNRPVALSQRVPVPDELDAIVMRCLEREPHQRFADVAALGAALDHLLADGDTVDDEVTRTVDVDAIDSQDRTMFSLPPPAEPARPTFVKTVKRAPEPANVLPAPPVGRASPPPRPPSHGSRGAQRTPSTPVAYRAAPNPPPPAIAPAGRPPPPVFDPGAFPPHAPPPHAPLPHAPPPRFGTPPPYDMASAEARDAAMRRFVWVAVLVAGALIGVIVASQL